MNVITRIFILCDHYVVDFTYQQVSDNEFVLAKQKIYPFLVSRPARIKTTILLRISLVV